MFHFTLVYCHYVSEQSGYPLKKSNCNNGTGFVIKVVISTFKLNTLKK